jgi:tetratricopeptide (TPR) repeat protein
LAQERLLQTLLRDAATAWDQGHYDEASKAYEKAISIYRTSDVLQDQQGRNNLALLANNFAWMLVTRPDPQPGDPEKAVENARLALATAPSEGHYWNTLGAAQYRAKNWQGAKDALMRSMELRGDGDGYDWILFALLYSQTGPKSHALEWYAKAARWRRDFGSWDRELYAFDAEAAERLGLPKPPAPTPRRSYHSHSDDRESTYKGHRMPRNSYMGDPRHGPRFSHRLDRR